jgi:hypothetical protein
MKEQGMFRRISFSSLMGRCELLPFQSEGVVEREMLSWDTLIKNFLLTSCYENGW